MQGIYLLFYKVSYIIVYTKHMLSIYNLKYYIIFFMSGIRHVVVTYCRSTSVVRNLRFLTLPYFLDY